MTLLILLLYVLAAVCFLAAAFGVTAGRVNLLALGLFFWVLTALLYTLK